MKHHKLISTILLGLSLSSISLAQWSCPSKMNAHLKPLWKDAPLSWAMEVEMGGGVLGDRGIMNGMSFAGLEYYNNNVEVYLELGVKHWDTWEDGMNLDNSIAGMREAYIGLHPGKNDIKVGFQSLQLNDQFIFNERAVGASFQRQHKGITLQTAMGTVSRKSARNGSFCSKCYLYDIIHDRPQSYLGAMPFEEFFAAIVLSIDPSKQSTKQANTNSSDEFQSFDNEEFRNEEFSTSEFGAADEFSDNIAEQNNPLLKLEEYGVLAYREWGEYYSNPTLWTGGFGSFTLPGNIDYRIEALYQHSTNNRGWFAINSLERQFASDLGYTDFNATFYYFKGIDANANAALSYTNLFLGEVLRLDAIEMPLVSVFIKHRFTGKGMSLKVQYAANFDEKQLSEINAQFHKNFKKHISFIATAGLLSGEAVKDYPYLGKIELRYTF